MVRVIKKAGRCVVGKHVMVVTLSVTRTEIYVFLCFFFVPFLKPFRIDMSLGMPTTVERLWEG